MILVKLVGTSNALYMRVVHGKITRKWIVKAWNITREAMEKKTCAWYNACVFP